MGGAVKLSSAKGFSPASDSGALTQSAAPRSYSLSDMHFTPDPIPEGQLKRGRSLQYESESKNMTRTGNREDLSLEDMAADLQVMNVPRTRLRALVNQHIVIRDSLAMTSQPLCLVAITAVVKREFRSLYCADIRPEHLDLGLFKSVVEVFCVGIDWTRDRLVGGNIVVENESDSTNAVEALYMPWHFLNHGFPLLFVIQTAKAG
jgi:hypothetical protein